MTKIEARRIIRKAAWLTSNHILRAYQERGDGPNTPSGKALYWDVLRVLQGNRCRPGNPNYDRVEAYVPSTIPHDIFEQAMSTITDKMLDKAINWGIKDSTGE